ncbi:hypothetical protein GCM10007863_08680 [Dyella mobilis]|nr:hypothetical protein GCM10007863_08680 [Dyella mobilis]
MADMFGHAWVSQYGADPAGHAADTWGAALASLTPKQLATGLHATHNLGSDFPPSSPRFRKLCLGIPEFAAVEYELRTNKGARSPFLRQVWSYVDGYLFARAESKKAERMLREAYGLAVEYAMKGGTLPYPIEGELEAPKPEQRKPASAETAEAELQKMRDILRENEPEAEQVEGEATGDECHPLSAQEDGV